MREIKFRAWSIKENRVVRLAQSLGSDTYLSMNNHSWGVFEDGNGVCTCNKLTGDILMQYTGLNDKNGKEIYEGDIVKVEKYIGEVKFGRYTYSACDEYGCDRYGYYIDCETKGYIKSSGIDIGCCIYDCEVVGNIYENQELLNG